MSSLRRFLGSALLAAAVSLALGACAAEEPPPTPTTAPAAPRPPAAQTPASSGSTAAGHNKSYGSPPAMAIDVNKRYFVNMETEAGKIRIELFPKKAPKTVNNFVFLARDGFYDGIIFHRVIAGFMAQGGDPTGTGMGGPGYRFEDEFSDLAHVRGALSMANSGPNTNGSQFFIVYEPAPHLNGRHSVFGVVVEGMDNALKITLRPDGRTGPFTRIQRVTIEEI